MVLWNLYMSRHVGLDHSMIGDAKADDWVHNVPSVDAIPNVGDVWEAMELFDMYPALAAFWKKTVCDGYDWQYIPYGADYVSMLLCHLVAVNSNAVFPISDLMLGALTKKILEMSQRMTGTYLVWALNTAAYMKVGGLVSH